MERRSDPNREASMRPANALFLTMFLVACGGDDEQEPAGFPAGTWQGNCTGDLELEIELVLDADGVGTILVTGDMEKDEAVEAMVTDSWIQMELENTFVNEVEDTHHGGSYSIYSQLWLEGDWDPTSIVGTCWDMRTNTLAEDDSTWGDEGELLLEFVG